MDTPSDETLWQDLAAPDLATFEALARAAFETLPAEMRAQCASVVIRVADLAETEELERLGLDDPFELTGLYAGVALTEKSHADIAPQPDEVWLFRRAILDEWADRGDVTLGALVTHVLVHEIAHHFGWSDDDIAAVDDWRL